jgi:hypothetical protein
MTEPKVEFFSLKRSLVYGGDGDVFDGDNVKKVCEFEDKLRDEENVTNNNGFLTAGADRMLCVKVDEKVVGKVEYKICDDACKIIWFNAPGFGAFILGQLESVLREEKVGFVELLCSLSESEADATCLRRLNFYMHHGFSAKKVLYGNDSHGQAYTKLTLFKKL